LKEKLPRPALEVLRKARGSIKSYKMLEGGERVILAVSGGPDSLVLLDVMYRLREEFDLELEVFHVDHGLRPGSGEEADYVKEAAALYGLPFSTERVEVSRVGTGGKALSPEEAAREVRYRALEARMRKTGADRVAQGHQADDRVETLLMRLCSGAGPRALASSVPPVRGPFIRPLVRVWRREILGYLPALPLPPLHDPSNLDLSIPRNRIRHLVLPLLAQEINPNVKESLLRALELMEGEVGTGSRRMEEDGSFQSIFSLGGGSGPPSLALDGFLALGLAERRETLHALLRDLGVRPTFRLVESLRRDVCEGWAGNRMDLPGDIVAVNEYDRVLFLEGSTFRASRPCPEEVVPEKQGEYGFPDLNVKLYLRFEEVSGDAGFPADPWEALLDRDLLQFPLRLRRLKPGDRFRPLGAPGTKKIQDFLTDARFPRRLRGEVLAVVSGERIVWLPGLRISEDFKITERTRRMVRLKASPINRGAAPSSP